MEDNRYNINTKNIKINDTFKNERELFRAVNVDLPRKIGQHKREAVQKEIKTYINYEKTGKGYEVIVTQKFDIPIEKPDKRRRGVYIKAIELILMNYLKQKIGKHYCVLTRKTLKKILGLVNSDYGISHTRLTKESDFADLDKHELDLFYARVEHRQSGIIDTALNSLENRKLIGYKKWLMVREQRGEEQDDGRIIYNIVHRPATGTEFSKFLAIQNNVLHEMGYSSEAQVIKNAKVNEYNDKVNAEVIRQCFDVITGVGAIGIYKAIEIYFNPDVIEKRFDENVEEFKKIYNDYISNVKELNKIVVQKIDENAITKNKNTIKKQYSEYEKYLEKKKTDDIGILSGGIGQPEPTLTLEEFAKSLDIRWLLDIPTQKQLCRRLIKITNDNGEVDSGFIKQSDGAFNRIIKSDISVDEIKSDVFVTHDNELIDNNIIKDLVKLFNSIDDDLDQNFVPLSADDVL